VYTQPDAPNHITIQSNLIHNTKLCERSSINDPNAGFVVGLCEAILMLDPTAQITLGPNCNLYNTQIHSKTKFWECLSLSKDNIEVRNRDNEIVTRPDKWVFLNPQSYFKYSQGEKLVSIWLHNERALNRDMQCLFHNHGGCERSFIKIHNQYYRSTATDIPDLAMVDYDQKKVWLFEAKKNDPNKIIGAVAQVNESYNKWFVSNIKNKQLGGINWNEFTIYKKIITFGGENHPLATDQTRDYLYLSLLANGEALWY
jgi:hypothetical protein